MALTRIRMHIWLTALVGFFVAAMTALAYTTGQAQAGQEVFANVCAGCHGASLQGGVGPGLVSPAFTATWRNAAALFSFISQNMPLNDPGSLSSGQYWDLAAFLLARNGVSPGGEPLNEQTAEGVELRRSIAG
jgi:mono/diheme cytochrome c family protein